MEKAMLEKRRTGGECKHEDKRTVHIAQCRRWQSLGLRTRYKFMCLRYSHAMARVIHI